MVYNFLFDKKKYFLLYFVKLNLFSIFRKYIFIVENGHIKRITDPHIQTSVIEIIGTNVATCYITCPADPKKTLGIKLPFLVMIIKNV